MGSHGMGWDMHELLWNGMGWGRKICPMDKPGVTSSFSASLCLDNTAAFEAMSQGWELLVTLTDLRFEPQISRTRNEHVTAQPTGRLHLTMQIGLNIRINFK